ncbi:MAG: hypothetical protein KF785_01340 [Gemmatimonadales bacterium]|nr:hypothetical protein [Gemmatimonadales bacterium]
MTDRLSPFDLVFGSIAAERFPALRDEMAAAGHAPRDRDAFVLGRAAVALLRELGPDDTLGEGVNELVALTHAAYQHWLDDQAVVALDRATLDQLLRDEARRATPVPDGRSYYLQLPERRIWGEVETEVPREPLDGCFVIPMENRIELVAIFGLQPGRDGFTVVAASGVPGQPLARPDGTPLFAPRMAGGAAAGLWEITGGEELVELVHRCHALLPATGAAPGMQRVSRL